MISRRLIAAMVLTLIATTIQIPLCLADSPEMINTELPAVGEFIDGAAIQSTSGRYFSPERGAADRDLREGWPVDLSAPGAGFPYTPTLFDADGDGADEIFLTGGHTFGLRGDGTFLPGWPVHEHYYMGYGTNGNMPGPSAADLEGDGDVEIMWTTRDWYAGSSHMWTFNGREFNGTDMTGFPRTAPDESSNALNVPFVLGDTDGDGNLEAWGPHTRGNSGIHYRLSRLDHDGTLVFTTDLNTAETILSLFFGDLDGDGSEEMFSVSWLSPSYYLHLYQPDGSEAPGYPRTLHTLTSGYLTVGPPVPADLDQDGDLEILLGTWDSGSIAWAVAKHHDGSMLTGFPIQIATNSQLFTVSLGDVTGDRLPELIAIDNHLGSSHRLHVIDIPTGTPLAGFPIHTPGWPKGIPTVVDIDNDAVMDICLVTDYGNLHAYNGSGTVIDGFPKSMASGSISGVAAGDIDGDGLLELVAATWDGFVYAWDTAGAAVPGRSDWPMRGVDARNTGVYRGSGDMTDVSVAWADPTIKLGLATNPVRTRAEFVISGAANTNQVIQIFDPSGRRVTVLEGSRGDSVSWQPSSTLPNGVYLARIQGAETSETLKFVILR